jgi:hypothetical protein
MNNLPELPGCCRYCGGESIAHCKHIMTSGHSHLYALCLECGKNANGGGHWLPQNGVDMRQVPTRDELMAGAAIQNRLW